MSRPKFFRDPIHQQIRFDKVDLAAPPNILNKKEQISWLLQKTIDTNSFQRLRLIRQNGLANFVFHGAEHSRFQHSIGVHHVAKIMFERVCRNLSIEANEDTQLEILVAALIHDVGHGAFSHTLEEVFKSNGNKFHHEDMTLRFINDENSDIHQLLVQIDGSLPIRISEFFDKKLRLSDNWKYKIVSSQMDADRLDYVMRDAYFAGLRGHGFDFERLMDLVSVHDDCSIAIDRGAIEAVESYLVTIDQLYRAIYYHQAVRAVTQMFLSLMKRAWDLYNQGDKAVFPDMGAIKHPLIPLFEKGSTVDLRDYNRISDSTIWVLIDYWRESEDRVLADLSARIFSRRLLKQFRSQILILERLKL